MRKIEGRPRTIEGRRLYWVWAAMVQRCENPRSPAFKNYGAHGITVCPRWRSSFDAFVVDMGLPEKGLTIERADSTKGYAPDNCRWASHQEQNDNRPAWCIAVEINGDEMNLKQAHRKYAAPGLTYRAVHKRVRSRGWPLSMALLIPAGAA